MIISSSSIGLLKEGALLPYDDSPTPLSETLKARFHYAI